MVGAIEVALVLAVALGASILTLFSGFGLGTLLLPAFALVFPLHVAIAATAVVHLANNLWKGLLLGRDAEASVVVRFGLPALLGAVAGALLLTWVGDGQLLTYEFGGAHTVTAIGLLVGGLIVGFALFDLVPPLRLLAVDRKYLVPGGAVSGFFGGLSGHQGALRSVFLTKIGLDAKTFVATGILCAILVDVGRLIIYGSGYVQDASELGGRGEWGLIGGAVAMAIMGSISGAKLLKKTTIEGLRILVGVMLLVVGPLIAAGLV
ncbi:MAG TPA: sulfite exporter TauE/SafE family protein [Candidatus Thermoplasmatota archaeon]|nr:sulfite exporter TauE/SafE family protein [Candidatus Thermoplasmatota archaeon]